MKDSIIISNHVFPLPNYKEIINYKENVNSIEQVSHPWPATYEELKREFMKVEIDDPIADLDLHLPTPEELRMLTYSLEGGFGLHLPLISILYNEFSKEAHSKEIYAGLVKKDKADKRYNKAVVSRITGLRNDDEIKKFMEYCILQIKFILESTDYELYAAILECYDEYCQVFPADSVSGE